MPTYDKDTKMLRGEPVIRRMGACSICGEMTPFVHEGRLYRMELNNRDYGVSIARSHARIVDVETGSILSTFGGPDFYYYSGFYENGTLYVFATGRSPASACYRFASRDLVHWEQVKLFDFPGFRFFNTGVAHGPDGYWMCIEANEPRALVGVPFTCFFLHSEDMLHWEMLPPEEYAYPRDRYCGGPCLKYSDGWYYLILVEEMPLCRYTNYIHRTRDFKTFETGKYNPLLPFGDPGDRKLSPRCANVPDTFAEEVATAFISSSSDVDLCEFEGKTYINYILGNQLSYYFTCEAEYDGPMADFLARFFD